jgi:hypothetical protein
VTMRLPPRAPRWQASDYGQTQVKYLPVVPPGVVPGGQQLRKVWHVSVVVPPPLPQQLAKLPQSSPDEDAGSTQA